MVQHQRLRVPDQEYVWIQSSLKRDLFRFPELESFKDDELRRLVIHWDDIFVRWLQRFYRPIGIEVEHEPENQAAPIKFLRLPGHDVKLPKPLGLLELKYEQVRDLVDTYGREGVVTQYLVGRLSQLSTASTVWPPRPLMI